MRCWTRTGRIGRKTGARATRANCRPGPAPTYSAILASNSPRFIHERSQDKMETTAKSGAKKLAWVQEELQGLREQGLYNTIRTIESAQGAWFVVNGRRVLNLCSNNYLGLANHPALKQAAEEAIEKYGVGPAAVRSIVGTLDLHLTLERRLAEFKGVP